MKTKKMTSTAKKRAKKAAIIAMAAAIGTTAADLQEAASVAMRDMKNDAGVNAFAISYTWDPFDGFCA